MHIQLPWLEGDRTPRPPAPRIWVPRLDRPLEVVPLAPVRRLAVHWIDGRHFLHFPDSCPSCASSAQVSEHGYVAALVRWCTDDSGVAPWIHGVAQLGEGAQLTVVYRSSDPYVYTLRRTRSTRGPVEVTRRSCPREVWLTGRPFDTAPTLERVYGLRWKDATGLAGRLVADRHAKGGSQ